MKRNIAKISSKVKTGDSRRGTPKMFASAKFWGRRLAGPVFTLLLFIAFIYSSNVSALTYQNATDLEFTFNPTLTIETPADLVISDLTPGSSSDSNIITVNTSSNSKAGYVVQASVGNASHATTELPLNGNTNNSSTNNNGSSSLSFIATDNTKTSVSNLDPDTWGSAYIYCNQEATNCNASGANPTWSSWTNYLALPLYNDAVNSPITISSRNDAGAIAFQFKIGAKSSTNKIAGEYSNVINFIMTANQITTNYTINYRDSDGTSAISPTIASQSGNGIEASTNVVLSSTIPTKTGYTFIGWCDGTVTSGDTNHSNGVDSCGDISKVYQPGSNYTVRNIGSTNYTITLRAMWRRNTYNVLVTFAGLAGSVGSVSFENTNYDTVNITEDGQTASLLYNVPYTITMTPTSNDYKLDTWATTASGTLGSTTDNPTTYTVTGDATLTASGGKATTTFAQAYAAAGKSQTSGYYKMQDMTSSICSSVTDGQSGTLRDTRGIGINYTVAKIGSLCWMTRNLDLPGGITIYKTDSNITADSYKLPASSTSGFYNDSTANVYNSDSTNFNDTSCGNNNPCYSYYSYAAATAGTNPSSGEASSDICPKGWRLPTQAEFKTLIGTYTTGVTLTVSPFLGVYAGLYNSSSFANGGSRGYYWTSTAYSSSNAYRLYLTSSTANVNYDNGYKHLGQPIRCVAKS